MSADLSFATYFAPVMAFLVVFLVCFAVLFKSKILGESKWLTLFVSFVIASLFISAAGVRRYVEVITPWFGALIVSLFFILLLISFVGGKTDGITSGIKWLFVIVTLTTFFISGIVVFSSVLSPYLPGDSYVGNTFTDWLYSPRVIGALILLIITAVVSWVLVKAK